MKRDPSTRTATDLAAVLHERLLADANRVRGRAADLLFDQADVVADLQADLRAAYLAAEEPEPERCEYDARQLDIFVQLTEMGVAA